jgi:cupin fold WbuC family metalloprotein
MIRFHEHNPEVLYTSDPIVQIDRADIEAVVARAEQNPRRRIRLCTHRDTRDTLHEMLIVHTSDTYVRPHKHLAKSEAFHIISGTVDVVLFDEAGKIVAVVPMGDYASGRKFYYRLADPLYHTLLIRSDRIIFHEITNGPFDRADTLFAPWSPDIDNGDAAGEFMKKLSDEVGRLMVVEPR